jgi:hypothetical protein
VTQTWHADEETLQSWAEGSAPPLLAASVEAHLLHCEECRRRTATLSARTTGDSVRRWDALADHIDRPRSIPLLRLGLATPGLRTAWLASILAPVAPLAAVALAYGRNAEPAGELALATPTAGLRLVARRAVLVALTAVPAGVGAALLTGLPVEVAFGWLLPGAALAALVALAGTTRLDPALVAASLGSAWAVVVSWPGAARRVPAEVVEQVIVSAPSQLIALAIALTAIVVVIVRRDTVAYRRTA